MPRLRCLRSILLEGYNKSCHLERSRSSACGRSVESRDLLFAGTYSGFEEAGSRLSRQTAGLSTTEADSTSPLPPLKMTEFLSAVTKRSQLAWIFPPHPKAYQACPSEATTSIPAASRRLLPRDDFFRFPATRRISFCHSCFLQSTRAQKYRPVFEQASFSWRRGFRLLRLVGRGLNLRIQQCSIWSLASGRGRLRR